MITHRQLAELCQMRPSNATARARSWKRPNSRYSEVLQVNQPETSCERPPKSSCRGFRGSSGGRRFEDDAVICLGDFLFPALELIVTRPWAVEHGPATRSPMD